MSYYYWLKPFLTILTLGFLFWLMPDIAIDPWQLLNPKKIVAMILALTMIQVIGSLLNHYLGSKAGAIMTGFLGGLIASTATTDGPAKPWDFEVLPILKLAIFIVFILVLSKLLQIYFGEQGLLILTFLVSLFEIHGSVISNFQIFESGTITIKLLTSLIAISILASYLSKVFLIHTLGHKNLRSKAIQSTVILFIGLGISWFLAIMIYIGSHV